jgi:hypothetical protein
MPLTGASCTWAAWRSSTCDQRWVPVRQPGPARGKWRPFLFHLDAEVKRNGHHFPRMERGKAGTWEARTEWRIANKELRTAKERRGAWGYLRFLKGIEDASMPPCPQLVCQEVKQAKRAQAAATRTFSRAQAGAAGSGNRRRALPACAFRGCAVHCSHFIGIHLISSHLSHSSHVNCTGVSFGLRGANLCDVSRLGERLLWLPGLVATLEFPAAQARLFQRLAPLSQDCQR